MPQQKPSHNLSDSSPENHERKRPTSERKIVANRQNSSKSTGPKTERGNCTVEGIPSSTGSSPGRFSSTPILEGKQKIR
jgi:hypothetical protein